MIINKDWAEKAIADIVRGTDGSDLRAICNKDEIEILKAAQEIAIGKEAWLRDKPHIFEKDSV